ncbi:MAG: mechanosensitive ion channel family protein [Actinomycetota bacterium]|nr:mechanosensitive ion channel family protein [Actinomycetota bacterium]
MLDNLADALPRVGVGVAVAVLAWALGRFVGRLVRRRYTRRNRPSFANVMGRVASLLLTFVGLLAAATVIFPTVKPVDVLGSLGIFSIAVGFAFRDILENLLAGILLLFRAPFLTGDEVDIDGTRGTVREINLRETVLRTYDGRRVLIPNATVYKNAIVVQTAYPAIRTEAVVGVAYGTDVATARELALKTLAALDLVLDDPAPQVLVDELGSSTIDLTLLWWSAPQQAIVLRARDAALAAVVGAYDDAGIEMPSEIVILDSTPAMREALSRKADA